MGGGGGVWSARVGALTSARAGRGAVVASRYDTVCKAMEGQR